MTTMLHLPYGPGIGPGPFTARKGSLFHETSFWPGAQPPGSFFGLTAQTIIPPERRHPYGPARLGISSENWSTITPRGARPRGFREGA